MSFKTAIFTVNIPLVMIVIALYTLTVLGEPQYLQDSIPFVTVEQGTNAHVADTKTVVINTFDEMDQFWIELHGGTSLVPVIDYDNFTVVGVCMGMRPSSGFSITIVAIVESADWILVNYTERVPGPDEIVLTVLTYPYHVVKMQKTDKPLYFQAVNQTGIAGTPQNWSPGTFAAKGVGNTVVVTVNNPDAVYALSLYSLRGQLLQKVCMPQLSRSIRMNCSRLPKGTYIVSAKTAAGTIHRPVVME